MVFDISQLKKIRRQLGMTQHAFAKQAGISQSMVAKIESEKLDPTYSKVQQIEKALASLAHQEEKKAHTIMTKHVVTVKPDERVPAVIKLMQQRGISQVPVVERKHVLGIISESSILGREGNISHLSARDVMTEIPPTVAIEAPLGVLKQLLQFYPCVLVKEREELRGIITKADLLKALLHA